MTNDRPIRRHVAARAHRHFEIYLSSLYAKSYGTASGTLPALELNDGPLPNVQRSLAVALSANRASKSAPWKLGYGDTTFGVNVR